MEVFGLTMGTQEWKSLFFFLLCKWRIYFTLHKVSYSTYLFHKKVTNIANFLAGDERTGARKGNLFFTLSAVARSPRVQFSFCNLAPSLVPLQAIGSATQQKLQTIQVICTMGRRKCPGDKCVPWKAEYLPCQPSAGSTVCISTVVSV